MSNTSVFIPNGALGLLLWGLGLLTVGVAVGRRLREVGSADNGRNFVKYQNASKNKIKNCLRIKCEIIAKPFLPLLGFVCGIIVERLLKAINSKK